ncbi:MAG: hypothetical protein AAF696_08235 [Bacteroidota bacterium]
MKTLQTLITAICMFFNAEVSQLDSSTQEQIYPSVTHSEICCEEASREIPALKWVNTLEIFPNQESKQS